MNALASWKIAQQILFLCGRLPKSAFFSVEDCPKVCCSLWKIAQKCVFLFEDRPQVSFRLQMNTRKSLSSRGRLPRTVFFWRRLPEGVFFSMEDCHKLPFSLWKIARKCLFLRGRLPHSAFSLFEENHDLSIDKKQLNYVSIILSAFVSEGQRFPSPERSSTFRGSCKTQGVPDHTLRSPRNDVASALARFFRGRVFLFGGGGKLSKNCPSIVLELSYNCPKLVLHSSWNCRGIVLILS